ncbi:integrase catalytic domain-containing protein [Trichonephila clavipes]|uniref:RNA-directed DNA polymerase n=1 Tax=Trichonephila clavipes TaxID=2585209 RepID=A0A8X6UZ45_TRICX|nr:integrase catalytic domain-containing protein [Trichonephila clavipes]
MQREDSVLRTIIQKIDQNDVSPQISNYFINGEGLLCHLSKRPSRSPRSNTTRKEVCIPHCLKAKILESVHSEYGGHLKFFKTYHRLSENFFWHNMYKDTKNFVRFCTICLSRKNAFKIPPAPHQLVEQSTEPGERCHMDIFGPLKTTLKAHANGRVEKPNQSLANILASITQNTNDWDEQLPHTMLALNSAIHEATYTSPFSLEHGRAIRLSYTYEKNSDTPQKKPKFEGPYRVIERFSNVNYRVQHVEQLRKRFNTHVKRMIPFIKRFSYLHLKNLDDLQPDETEDIMPSGLTVHRVLIAPRVSILQNVENVIQCSTWPLQHWRSPGGIQTHRFFISREIYCIEQLRLYGAEDCDVMLQWTVVLDLEIDDGRRDC